MIKRGLPLKIYVEFKTRYATKSLKTKIYAKKWFMRTELNIPYKIQDTCKFLNTQCPLPANKDVIFTHNHPVSLNMIPIDVELEGKFVDDMGRSQMCFKILVKLV